MRSYLRIRFACTVALCLLLLLISLPDVARHELLCRDEPAPPATAAGVPISEALVTSGDVEQDHDCSCCGLAGSRISLVPWATTEIPLVVAGFATARHSVAFVKPSPAIHPGRGPPIR